VRETPSRIRRRAASALDAFLLNHADGGIDQRPFEVAVMIGAFFTVRTRFFTIQRYYARVDIVNM